MLSIITKCFLIKEKSSCDKKQFYMLVLFSKTSMKFSAKIKDGKEAILLYQVQVVTAVNGNFLNVVTAHYVKTAKV